MRAILQNTYQYYLQTVKVMKDKEKLRNCQRPDDTKKTYGNHTQYGILGWIQELKRTLSEKLVVSE